MKKGRITICMIVSFLVLSSSISVAQQQAISKNIEKSRETTKNYVHFSSNSNKTYGFTTFGPRALTVSKITVQNGSFNNESLRWLNLLLTIGVRLGLLMFPLIRPTVWFVSDTDPVDFTVEYKRDIPLGMLSRQKYFTFINEMENGTIIDTIEIWNEKHTVKVEGFYGIYQETKRSVMMPPSFLIVGICENVTLIQ
jgi:hypothetical protein